MNSTARLSHRRCLGFLAALWVAWSLAACGAPQPTPTPVPTPTPTATPTPTPQPSVSTSASVAAAGATQIIITEQQINEQLQSALASQEALPISDLSVNLQPGLFTATGQLTLGFLNSDVKLSVRLNTADGKVVPEVVEILLNDRPAPALLRAQVDAFIQPLIEEISRADYGFFVESVEVTEDEIRVYGR
uniref:DUF2993 domain-containing protein n=1 Tax=Caldilinea aerophila TaxID=133453 RepID=A0A7C1J8A7_9CHLR